MKKALLTIGLVLALSPFGWAGANTSVVTLAKVSEVRIEEGKIIIKGSGMVRMRVIIDKEHGDGTIFGQPAQWSTPEQIQSWKNQDLTKAASTSQGDRNARTTMNSLIRNAKALFSRRILPLLSKEIDLPDLLPFDGITMERQPSLRYLSRIDAKKLLKEATKTLRTECPEAYKIFLLSLVCGLPAKERRQ